jgi:hypothetical protein
MPARARDAGWRFARPVGSIANRRNGDMHTPYTAKEISRIIAGAVTSLVIVGWMVFLAIGYLSAR